MSYYIAKDHFGNYDLVHAQEWKQHKYIRKEGNRYIYPEDLRSNQKLRDTSSLRGIANLAKTPLQETKNAHPNSSNGQSIKNAINSQKVKNDLSKAKEQRIQNLPNGQKLYGAIDAAKRQAGQDRADPDYQKYVYLHRIKDVGHIADYNIKNKRKDELIEKGVPPYPEKNTMGDWNAYKKISAKAPENTLGQTDKEKRLETLLRTTRDSRYRGERRYNDAEVEKIWKEYKEIKDPERAEQFLDNWIYYLSMDIAPRESRISKATRERLTKWVEEERRKRDSSPWR